MPQLPYTFIESLAGCAGFRQEDFVRAHDEDSPVSIRLNSFKSASLPFDLGDPVPWSSFGYYLGERPGFTHDMLFQAGCYYVQEPGSMFLEQALRSCVDLGNDLAVLDLCAAPGGKSTLLNSLITANSLLVANEVVKARAEVLAHNLAKWGTANVLVTNNDPSVYATLDAAFDVIVVDAPCSGSGLFRKQPDAVDEWSPDHVNLCSQRQRRIAAEVLPALKPGGILVYSTCSYSVAENEAMADWLVESQGLQSIRVPVEPAWGIVETRSDGHDAYGYRFYPDQVRSEGFFCAVFRKAGELTEYSGNRKVRQEHLPALKPKERELFQHWLSGHDALDLVKFKDDYLLMNVAARQFANRYPQLYLKKLGTTVGSLVRNDLIPHQDLAWSIYRSAEVQQISCSQEEALRFMKKELQSIDGHKGWNLMTFQGFGLGWIKHLGNRVNNYLPNEFRILR